MNATVQRLIVFTRLPQPGSTKTRLIPVLGAGGAAGLQRCMTEAVMRWAQDWKSEGARRSISRVVEVRHDGDVGRVKQWLGKGLEYRSQCTASSDLGLRMLRAFEEGCVGGPVVIVGTDVPDLNGQLIDEAFERLRTHPVVIGPAHDGGYYLIGLQRPLTFLFTDETTKDGKEGVGVRIPWGSDRVLAITRQRLERHGVAYAMLPPLGDVDLPVDLHRAAHLFKPRLSVIIPALNEARCIGRTIASLPVADEQVECLVVDGGSTDDTGKIAEAAGARVVSVQGGRGRQLNIGAEAARGWQLLFLHADTLLPADFARTVDQTLQRPGVALGAFRLGIAGKRRSLRWIARAANLRSRLLRLPYGDQALFLTRGMFEQLGGFTTQPLMEDFALVRRARRRGRIVLAHSKVTTSDRRWRRLGVWRTTLRNQAIVCAYLLGVAPDRLARWYRR